jgi:Zn-dependent protease
VTTDEKVIFYGGLVVAIILHEISHGVVALFFGDDTAKRAHRLTLNPIRHIDPFGSIILPGMLLLAGQLPFGWAKPVPVDPAKLRAPRRDMLFVGLAGPATNLVLMLAAAYGARVLLHRWVTTHTGLLTLDHAPLAAQILFWFAFGNLVLGIFNLLPIPPLDGSSLVERILPRSWLPRWYQFRPYGLLILILIVFSTHALDAVLRPFEHALFRYIQVS